MFEGGDGDGGIAFGQAFAAENGGEKGGGGGDFVGGGGRE